MENKKNTATNNPEIVTLSRAEYESQQAQLTELKLQNQWLLEQLGLAKKRQFGKSSERLQEGLMDQLVLMANEAEAYAYGTKNATEEQVKVKAHARKRQSGNVLDIVPEGTPTEVVEHRLSEEERICDPHGSGGAPAFRRGTHLRCLRLGDGGDWERSPPEPEDGTGPVLDSGRCVLHLRL